MTRVATTRAVLAAGALSVAALAAAAVWHARRVDSNTAPARGALIGFAGPRVIEQTIRQKLPDGFQRSEFLLEHGMLDLIVDRREMKAALAKALRFMGQQPIETAQAVAEAVAEP